MTSSKSTKRALLTSALAILMCVAMLIGTTFAWFTDTASTAVNKIQAGNLKVDLEMQKPDGSWVSAKGQTLEFKKATNAPADEKVLWEPGCTYELPAVKVVNKGNLALKYTISLNGVQGNAKLLEAIDFTVKVGDTETALDQLNGTLLANAESAPIVISGHMKESAGNEYQGLSIDGIAITVNATQKDSEYDSFNNTYDKDAVLPVNATASGNLTVTSNSTQNSAEVSVAQTLSDGVMSVTYPGGVKLNTTGEVTGDTEKKTTVNQSLTYVGATPSSAMASITIGDGKAVAQYNLTLPVAADNDTPVTVTINYAKGLTGVQVYHSGTLLTTTGNANGESAVYDAATGVLTLTLKHASPIDIVYNAVLPANAKLVYTLDELEAAVGNLHDGDYILFGANIVQDKVDTTSGQITFARASDAEGDIEATLDLNGYVFDGQIGGFSFDNDGITVNIIGTEKVAAKYYEHATGHHMVKACAVYNYSGNTVLKSGLFESNNIVVMAYGGNVVVEDGIIHNTADGLCLYAVNDALVTVNGGEFSFGEGGALTYIQSGQDNPQIVINGGTFDASKGNAFCFKKFPGEGYDKCKVTVNGGNFTFKSAEDVVGYESTADKEWAESCLVIQGGTFNVNPTAYVDTDKYNVTNNGSTWTVTKK